MSLQEMRYPWCLNCRDNFPMREGRFDAFERSGKTFYCPCGHGLVVTQDSIVSQLRSSEGFLRRSELEVSRLHKQLECTKGVITRQRNRLIHGKCPYCGKNVIEIAERSMLQHIRGNHGK